MKPVGSERKEKTGGVAEWSVGGVQGDGRLEAQTAGGQRLRARVHVHMHHDEKHSAPRTQGPTSPHTTEMRIQGTKHGHHRGQPRT